MNSALPNQSNGPTEPPSLLVLVFGTLGLGVIAFGLSWWLRIPIGDYLTPSLSQIGIGVIATIPLAAFLYFFTHTNYSPFATLRETQLDFFRDSPVIFIPRNILIIGLAAGVCEELLFRGVFQVLAERYLPVAAALVITNILFGLLHWRTALYAVIAGIAGVYFGLLFHLTQNLLAPITAHALYDVIALYAAKTLITEEKETT